MHELPDRYTDVILEDVQSKLQTLLELVKPLTALPQQVRMLDERLIRVESKVTIIEAALTDYSKVQQNHELRITSLEQV